MCSKASANRPRGACFGSALCVPAPIATLRRPKVKMQHRCASGCACGCAHQGRASARFRSRVTLTRFACAVLAARCVLRGRYARSTRRPAWSGIDPATITPRARPRAPSGFHRACLCSTDAGQSARRAATANETTQSVAKRCPQTSRCDFRDLVTTDLNVHDACPRRFNQWCSHGLRPCRAARNAEREHKCDAGFAA